MPRDSIAPSPSTPRRSGAGRPRNPSSRPRSSGSTRFGHATLASSASEPPPKKRRYIPGGPGGGGRYIDEDGTEIPVGGTGPGGYNYIGPRGRIGRENAANGVTPVVYSRRDRSTRTRTVLPRSHQPAMRFNLNLTSAQAAAAAAQNDGYKPREERGWEEFHPELDIDEKLIVFSAEEVDGIPRPMTPAGVQSVTSSTNGIHISNGDIIKPGNTGHLTPSGSANGDTVATLNIPGTPGNKRRPGRPPRDPVAFYAARAAAVSETPKTPVIAPLQNQHAKERLTLPQPSFRKVDTLSKFEDKAAGLVRYVEKSMANVGYQESDVFIRPERQLIKAIDGNLEEDIELAPSKSDTDANGAIGSGGVGRVEYDMDEQDDKWLEAYNAQRKAMDIEPITREIFEITITKIEKEWHALEKRIPKPNPKPPQTHRPRSSSAAAVNGEPLAGEEQDSKCAICDDGDCENTNAIVFCDGCDLAVHQECYGVPFIPEGQWLCRRCQLIGRGIPTCIFCPNFDGAFKQTNASKWAHLLCAMWIPEVSLGNHTFMEPVMDVEKVPKTRWKLTCYLCNQRMGACIQCGNKACYQAFHVTCARRARLYLKMKNSHGTLAVLDGTTILKAFCDKHCPPEYSKENDVSRATREARHYFKKAMRGRIYADNQTMAAALAATHRHVTIEHLPDESQMTNARPPVTASDAKKKGNQPPKLVWKLPSGAPVIPAVVFDAVETSLQRFTIRKRKDYAAETCRYWTLKREFRRGAALLKRLQLQMETFSSMEITRRNFAGMGPSGRLRLERRIDFDGRLVDDLEKLKSLCQDVVEREAEKLKSAELEEDAVNTIYFPIWKFFPPILDKALMLDIKNVFTKGLLEIQSNLNKRSYVLASVLAQDLSAVFITGIETEPIPKQAKSLAEEHVELMASSKNNSIDIKERKKLAKRIIKAIQPQLEAATRAEAEVTNKSVPKMVHELEVLLEASLQPRPQSIIVSVPDPNMESEVAYPIVRNENVDCAVGVDTIAVIKPESETLESIAVVDGMDVDLHDEDAPGEEVDDVEIFAPVPASTQTSIPTAALVSDDVGDRVSQSGQGLSGNAIKSSDTPPDTNGYIPALEHHQPAPPTPPISTGGARSTNDQDGTMVDTNSLTDGGIPWYMRKFDPIGTTVLDKQWTGRDIVRGMSEELSEIDDDELKGMGEEMEGIEGDTPVVEGKSDPVVRSKKGKVKRRWRGYR